MTRRSLLAAGPAGVAAALAAAGTGAARGKRPAPERRVVDCAARRDVAWRDLGARLARADAVFAGEFHDDPETHRAELALLQTLHERGEARLTLAMEMLERDGQAALDAYLAGTTDEAAFRKAATLWPNYAADYRPLVEYARANGIPVLASNAPGRIVKRVGREGLAAVLPSLPREERGFVAAFVNAPEGDAYVRRFADVVGGSHGDSGMDAATVRRFYEAQCLRDDTMAESVARALDAGRKVLHVNGGFHSDAGLGTVQRVLWRKPLRAPGLAVVKFVPVRGDLAAADPAALLSEADYVVFVPDRRSDKEGGGAARN